MPLEQEQVIAIQEAIDLAVKHHNAGDLPKAEGIYQQILKAHPNQPVVLHLLGVIAHQVGKNDISVDLITKALAIEPDYAEAHSNLGNVLREIGQIDEFAETVILGGDVRQLGARNITFSDVNGDGLDDPMLGDLGASYLFYSPLSSGALTSADANATFPELYYPEDAGDLDGDGRADLLLYHPIGSTYHSVIFYGQPTE